MSKWFTPEERGVVLFIVLVLIVGVCIYVYKMHNPRIAPELQIAAQINNNACLPSRQARIEQIISESKDKKLKAEADKINVNNAGVDELTELPGIGPVYAERIVSYRKEHGNFKAPEDIMNIKGIGEKTFEKFKDKITI